ncbi:hypothetical protein Fcan01_23367 [Folsomia candida]|uniref:Uncharacterized protein n=1 Tax=Folsomia candida TaxID=158441 RepID=A0A226D8C8_FOLCA|nr:hypothetical protein Fcan01_23367 [Folsomia candida]
MDLLLGRTATLGLMLSVFLSVAVVAYRNDLSTNRHGCVWSTMEKEAAIPTPSIASSSPPGPYISGLLINPPHQQHGLPGGGGGGGGLLNCNLRTLNVDFWNYTFNRDQIEQTRVVRIKCSDKLFFESVLTPNQTLFQLRNLKEVQIESCKIRKIPKRVWASLTGWKSLPSDYNSLSSGMKAFL